MRIDPHIHTYRSGHSLLMPKDVVRAARRRGIEAIAITDHDDVEAAFELSKVFPTVIGEEVSSDCGDIIGLFLTEHVKKGPVLDVMDEIRSQGGLVVIPHPFDSLRREAVNSSEICARADIIEVFNSRTMIPGENRKAEEFASENSLPMIVGSDAHTAFEIGRSWNEVDSIETPSKFLSSLDRKTMHCRRSPFVFHLQTRIVKSIRRTPH